MNVQAATADATVVTLSSLAADAKVDSLSPIAADIFPSPSTGADVGGKDEAPPATSAAEVEKNSVSEPNPNQGHQQASLVRLRKILGALTQKESVCQRRVKLSRSLRGRLV